MYKCISWQLKIQTANLSDLFADIDECGSSPCQNGGTCTDLVDGYTCTCSAGYTGSDCETGKTH